MNNCPKCGNPLQPGVSTCPICGTVINQATPAAPGAPVQPAAPAPAPVANPGVAPTTPTAVPGTPVPPAVPTPGTPAAPVPGAPVAPVSPVPGTPVPPVQASPVPGAPAPGPIPGSPAALAAEAAAQATAKQEEIKALKGEKKPLDKKVWIFGGVGAALIIVVAVVIILLNSGNKSAAPAATNNTPARPVATTTKVVAGSYEFSRPTGWDSSENNGYVYISKDDESAVIILNRVNTTLNNADVDSLKAAAAGQQLQNSEVTEIQVNGKKAFFLEAIYNSLPVEYYYIDYSPVTVIASVVYTKEEAKTNYSAEIAGIIDTIVYNDSTNAASSFGMYGLQAMLGASTLNNANIPTTPSSSNTNTTDSSSSSSSNSSSSSSSTQTTPSGTTQTTVNG